MKKEFYKEIEIPSGVEVYLEGNKIKVVGAEGENEREFQIGHLEFKKNDGKILIGYKKTTKKEKKLINTITSHLKNMIKGVQKKFEYNLKICFSHFPMTLEIHGNEVVIKNFLGESVPRKMKILKGVEVTIEKDIIKVVSVDKELAGQTAANFETATKIRKRDKRVFQDGIFMINKAGREI